MSAPLHFYVKRLSETAKLPVKGSIHAAGYDLFASQEVIVPARGKNLVPTGIAVHVPAENYGRIAPRSGLAVKNFIDTGAGVVDEDYRGEIFVLLFNHGEQDFPVAIGDRIAQMIIEKISPTQIIEVDNLNETDRGEGRFGSTGMKEDELKKVKAK